MAAACASPIASLPHTNFQSPAFQQQQAYQQQSYQQPTLEQHSEPHYNYPPPPPRRVCFSPQLTRDNYQEQEDENVAISNQVSFVAC